MEDKSMKKGFLMAWGGLKMFGWCALVAWWKSVIKALVDTARGIVKHPVEALLIVGVVVYQFVVICNQRVERDQRMQETYKTEQTLDSLKTQAEFQQDYIATLKNESNGTTKGSKELN